MKITFGTDGWRGIIGEDFTLDNAKKFTLGVVHFLKESKTKNSLMIGYDTRFNSKLIAHQISDLLIQEGVNVFLSNSHVPTPVITHSIKHQKADGAIMVTASHNPFEWNGLKFRTMNGISPSSEITMKIQNYANNSPQQSHSKIKGICKIFDPKIDYFNGIKKLINLEKIKNSNYKIIVDPMYGAGINYLIELLGKDLIHKEIHNVINPIFPGLKQPEPINSNLNTLKKEVVKENADIGIAFDADADRLGIVTSRGEVLSTLDVYALLAKYLLKDKSLKGPLVKTITSTNMLSEIGRKYGIKVLETPVGFKYVAPKMIETSAIMGGEESGGYAFSNHLFERDGIFSALMFLEMLIETKQPLLNIFDELKAEYGNYFYKRFDCHLEDNNKKKQLIEKVSNLKIKSIGNVQIINYDNIDGLILHFKNGWLLFRFSGTEPLLRIYCETQGSNKTETLISTALDLLGFKNNNDSSH